MKIELKNYDMKIDLDVRNLGGIVSGEVLSVSPLTLKNWEVKIPR